MNFDDFGRYRDQAIMLHASQTDGPQLSLDAVFLALVANGAPVFTSATDDPPAWFHAAREGMAGQRVTIDSFLTLAGRPITDQEQRAAIRWLRRLGIDGADDLFQL